MVIVVTYPKVRFNPNITSAYQDYCYYQLIKYSSWSINDLEIMKDKETAIERYKDFYESTTAEIRLSLQFDSNLGTRINEERNEPREEIEEDDSIRDEWMQASDVMPKSNNIFCNLIDRNFDWTKSRENYSQEQLYKMKDWIQKNKELAKDMISEDIVELPDVNPDQLNRLQHFTYKLVEVYKNKKEQLLMILLGTAGTGKSYTVAALTKLYLGILKRACPTAKAAFLISGEMC